LVHLKSENKIAMCRLGCYDHSVGGPYKTWTLWALDWTVIWILDSIMDSIFGLEF